MDKLLSVVIPAYNEEAIIERSIGRIRQVLAEANIPHELILVDDGSTDATWDKLCRLAEQNEAVTALRFSRNFGKEGAVFAGLEASAGACTAVMDCDLQHPPELLVEMYRLWERCGYELVEAVKSSRGKESPLSRLFANGFYGVLKWLSGIDMKNTSDFKLMDKKVVDTLMSMPERQTFFRGMATWVGYKRTSVLFDVPPREGGSTKWSKRALYRLATSAITSYSSLPLHFVTMSGVVFLLFGIVLAVQTLIMKFTGRATDGFTTVILLLIIVGSIIMLGLGIIGSYLAKIYEEVKGRPRYIVADKKRKDKR